jgi:hypothetical protein
MCLASAERDSEGDDPGYGESLRAILVATAFFRDTSRARRPTHFGEGFFAAPNAA